MSASSRVEETRVENDNRFWYIPHNLASASNPDFDDTMFTHYFENNRGATKMFAYPEQFDSSKWFVFNKQQMGFYRVNYDFANWHELIKILNSDKFKQIHVLNRAQLIDDSLNLAADGYLGNQVREVAMDWMCRMDDLNCLMKTYAHLQKAVEDNTKIPDSLEVTVICNGLKGVGKEFEFVEM